MSQESDPFASRRPPMVPEYIPNDHDGRCFMEASSRGEDFKSHVAKMAIEGEDAVSTDAGA